MNVYAIKTVFTLENLGGLNSYIITYKYCDRQQFFTKSHNSKH